MFSIDKIELLFMQHNNILTTAELSANKIYYTDIQKLLSDGMESFKWPRCGYAK